MYRDRDLKAQTTRECYLFPAFLRYTSSIQGILSVAVSLQNGVGISRERDIERVSNFQTANVMT